MSNARTPYPTGPPADPQDEQYDARMAALRSANQQRDAERERQDLAHRQQWASHGQSSGNNSGRRLSDTQSTRNLGHYDDDGGDDDNGDEYDDDGNYENGHRTNVSDRRRHRRRPGDTRTSAPRTRSDRYDSGQPEDRNEEYGDLRRQDRHPTDTRNHLLRTAAVGAGVLGVLTAVGTGLNAMHQTRVAARRDEELSERVDLLEALVSRSVDEMSKTIVKSFDEQFINVAQTLVRITQRIKAMETLLQVAVRASEYERTMREGLAKDVAQQIQELRSDMATMVGEIPFLMMDPLRQHIDRSIQTFAAEHGTLAPREFSPNVGATFDGDAVNPPIVAFDTALPLSNNHSDRSQRFPVDLIDTTNSARDPREISTESMTTLLIPSALGVAHVPNSSQDTLNTTEAAQPSLIEQEPNPSEVLQDDQADDLPESSQSFDYKAPYDV